ncbi:MAG TPA: hypothetical protein VGX00_01195 [Thermoplasmata archaeon]|nr:hypothetical protein [Thermoplasmata archaeon]
MAAPTPMAPTLIRSAFYLILGVVAALLFLLIYLALPQNDHVGALLTIGFVSLIFAGIAYFGQAMSAVPASARAWSFGFAGLGFGLLFLTLGLAPGEAISFTNRVLGLIVVLLALAAALAMVAWGWRNRASDTARAAEHANWAARPPVNALDYPAAAPATSSPATPPKEGAPR